VRWQMLARVLIGGVALAFVIGVLLYLISTLSAVL
jgi:hypothetical protein